MSRVIFRLISFAGFGRLDLPSTSTFIDMKKEISKILNIDLKDLKIYADVKMTQAMLFPDSTNILKLGIKEGDAIHIGNKQESINNLINTTNVNKNKNKKEADVSTKPWPSQIKTENVIVKESKSELEKQREKLGLTPKCNHAETSKCLHCMSTPNYNGNIKYNCNHGENAKCPNCLGKDMIENAKHMSFDEFLNARKQKCKGSHDLNSKCNNCMPPLEVSYKMKKGCTNHLPYPEGMCTKCIPPGVSLGRQIYRHVDYVSFMNIEEVNSFVKQWQKDLCLKQRMAYLFGYFAEDPNYAQGIRAVIEALYEPPQIGDHHGVHALENPDAEIIDRVAAGLNLEFVGWIFTTIDTDKDTYIASYDIKKAAEFQEHNKLKHPSGYYVSKFITVMVKPKDDGNVELE